MDELHQVLGSVLPAPDELAVSAAGLPVRLWVDSIELDLPLDLALEDGRLTAMLPSAPVATGFDPRFGRLRLSLGEVTGDRDEPA